MYYGRRAGGLALSAVSRVRIAKKLKKFKMTKIIVTVALHVAAVLLL